MRRFVSILLHSRIKLLHMPSCRNWDAKNKSEFENLLEVIGAQCSGLITFRFIFNWFSLYDVPALTRESWYGRAFFKALPRLTSLQVVDLEPYPCDDWAFQQFGEHGHNIV